MSRTAMKVLQLEDQVGNVANLISMESLKHKTFIIRKLNCVQLFIKTFEAEKKRKKKT